MLTLAFARPRGLAPDDRPDRAPARASNQCEKEFTVKITEVQSTPPRIGPMLVRVHTDAGISGVGECSGRNPELVVDEQAPERLIRSET